MKYYLTHNECITLCRNLVNKIDTERNITKIYPIPRGGVPVAYIISSLKSVQIVDKPEHAHYIVDDIVDSGTTRAQYVEKYPSAEFLAMISQDDNTIDNMYKDRWIIFPWENTLEGSAEDIVTRLLQFIGEDPKREGLIETPARVIKAWEFWTSGYNQNVASVFKAFEDGGEKYDQMVVVKDIPFYTFCEHHLAPFFGTATIGYIPDGKIVGLSKLSRLIDIYSRRLQVQERLTCQITDAIMEHLSPIGCGVVIKARHLCMESRGVCQQGHHTITSSLQGNFKTEPQARAEFLELTGSS